MGTPLVGFDRFYATPPPAKPPTIPFPWHGGYRNYMIDSFNADKPYDKFSAGNRSQATSSPPKNSLASRGCRGECAIRGASDGDRFTWLFREIWFRFGETI